MMSKAQEFQTKSELLKDIRSAFDRETPPSLPGGWEHLTDDTSSENYSEVIEETYKFWGKSWSELKMVDFEKCTRVFSFLPREDVPYFLGALMEISLQEEPYSHELLELFTLFEPSMVGRKKEKQYIAFNKSQIGSFSTEQLRTIIAFLKFLEAAGLADERSGYMQRFLREHMC